MRSSWAMTALSLPSDWSVQASALAWLQEREAPVHREVSQVSSCMRLWQYSGSEIGKGRLVWGKLFTKVSSDEKRTQSSL